MKVLEVVGQKEYKNPYFGGRIIKVDIYARDASGEIYDIEVQRSDEGAVPRRARFNNAMLDVRMLEERQQFKEIKDSYVIFITQNDIMSDGLPLYHVERTVEETGKKFGDGSHIIYVNGAYKNDDDPIGRLVHDFGCVRSVNMYNDLLRKRVHYFKELEGGKAEMCAIIEEVAEKRANKTRIEDIKSIMDELKVSSERAMEILRIPLAEQSILKNDLNKL